MKIERMNKGSWGKVRAFFDIRTEEGLVYGFDIYSFHVPKKPVLRTRNIPPHFIAALLGNADDLRILMNIR